MFLAINNSDSITPFILPKEKKKKKNGNNNIMKSAGQRSCRSEIGKAKKI